MADDSLATSLALGRKVKHARNLRGMTLAELARRVGVNPSTIYTLEAEKKNDISSVTLAAIAKELRIDPAYFFRDDLESPFDIASATGEELPDEIKSFILDQDVLPWVQLREHCKLFDVGADDMRAMIDAVLQIKAKVVKKETECDD